jgi:hypothetical protein
MKRMKITTMGASAVCGLVLLTGGCSKNGHDDWVNAPLRAPNESKCSDAEPSDDDKKSEKEKAENEKQKDECEEDMERTKRNIEGQ